MEVNSQDLDEQRRLADFSQQADAVNLFSSGLPMSDFPSQSEGGAQKALKLAKNPSLIEPDQLMSAMTDQNHLVPPTNLGTFVNVTDINSKIGMLSKTLQESHPLNNFTSAMMGKAQQQTDT